MVASTTADVDFSDFRNGASSRRTVSVMSRWWTWIRLSVWLMDDIKSLYAGGVSGATETAPGASGAT